jgi:hypothetical protein
MAGLLTVILALNESPAHGWLVGSYILALLVIS